MASESRITKISFFLSASTADKACLDNVTQGNDQCRIDSDRKWQFDIYKVVGSTHSELCPQVTLFLRTDCMNYIPWPKKNILKFLCFWVFALEKKLRKVWSELCLYNFLNMKLHLFGLKLKNKNLIPYEPVVSLGRVRYIHPKTQVSRMCPQKLKFFCGLIAPIRFFVLSGFSLISNLHVYVTEEWMKNYTNTVWMNFYEWKFELLNFSSDKV